MTSVAAVSTSLGSMKNNLVMVGKLGCLVEPESYAGWSFAPDGVTPVRQVKGERQNEERSPGSPGWGWAQG